VSWIISQALYEKWHCLQGQAVESLEDTCSDGEQFAQLSGNPTQPVYLSPDKMTAFSRLSRFGMMCKKENYKPSFKSIVNKKIALFCCGTIHRCLRGKNDKTASLLGYTVSELKSHLESHFKPGMSWDNYGKGHESWSIDHTRPISSFPKSATIAEINALGNLRPMWHKENCSKGNKWERQ
jgi:hypothetical protein